MRATTAWRGLVTVIACYGTALSACKGASTDPGGAASEDADATALGADGDVAPARRAKDPSVVHGGVNQIELNGDGADVQAMDAEGGDADATVADADAADADAADADADHDVTIDARDCGCSGSEKGEAAALDAEAGLADGATYTYLASISMDCATCASAQDQSDCFNPHNAALCDFDSGPLTALCLAALGCELQQNCMASDQSLTPCFCGDASTPDCVAGRAMPNGVCVESLETAFGTPDAAAIVSSLTKAGTVGGNAGLLAQCIAEFAPIYPGCNACLQAQED